ncbi:hypothetical protein PGTUg99_031373 [Puccinia graminis f. sp. tritici]|uniref:Uncharacterized protein n=1 Tax=Puccinia graminis f. sp. tritici TaxID=56615 RepID=A0A5B0RWA9_PUCGR|nr:hypothetical protein PGTUg99_031373 [Puccinia graminis f. sp. tritici]
MRGELFAVFVTTNITAPNGAVDPAGSYPAGCSAHDSTALLWAQPRGRQTAPGGSVSNRIEPVDKIRLKNESK